MPPANLVAGNRKMNGLSDFLQETDALSARFAGKNTPETAIIPPFPYISALAAKKSFFKIGAQNCHTAEKGAFTGDVSAEMLKDVGAEYVIVGHSERRGGCGETNEIVKSKAEAALRAGLKPIICVGEDEATYRAGEGSDFTAKQTVASLPEGFSPDTCVIAYEPIWAIGTGLTPTEDEINAVCGRVRAATAEKFGAAAAEKTRILYGGSVNDKNAAAIAALSEVNGALVGGACLKNETFIPIIEAFA